MRKRTIKTKAFTLIELLIVITIIAILVSLGIASLRGATLRSKNTRIAADLAQVRKIAERIFTSERDGYVALCADESLSSANPDLYILRSSIEELQGPNGRIHCYSNQTSYCLNVSLVGGLEFFCIDGTGRFSSPFTPGGGLQLCANATSRCP